MAAALFCRMPGPWWIGNRQAAALAGVAPVAGDSGRKTGARSIHDGRERPRKLLYMAVLVVSHQNPDLMDLYDRLIRVGKARKVPVVAIMRKLIVMINSLMRDRRKWTPEPPIRFPGRRDSCRGAVRPEPTLARAACG